MAEKNSTLECGNCGTSFIAKCPTSKYCTRRCKNRALARKSWVKAPRHAITIHCLWCGCKVTRKAQSRDSKRYCGRSCSDRRIVFLAQERKALRRIAGNWAWRPSDKVLAEIAALRRIARYVENPRLTRRPCKRCKKPTVGVKRMSRTCAPCTRAVANAQAKRFKRTPAGRASKLKYKTIRRARLAIKAESFDPISIFERDRWTCQECGIATPIALRGSYQDNAPELDHVIPLALGGHHTRSNVRCTCRRCNGLKGATAPQGGIMGEVGPGGSQATKIQVLF